MEDKTRRGSGRRSSESRQSLRAGVGTIIVSVVFLVAGYLLFKSDRPQLEILSYIAFLWGGPGLAVGFQFIYKSLRQR